MKQVATLFVIATLLGILLGCGANYEIQDGTSSTITEITVNSRLYRNVDDDCLTTPEDATLTYTEININSQELHNSAQGYYSECDTNAVVLRWKVDPIFEYEYISLCPQCGFFAVSDGFPIVNEVTGEIEGELTGHGIDVTQLLYDGVLGLFGVHHYNESFQELSFYTADEFLLRFPHFANSLNLLHGIDSTKIVYEAYANHVWVLCKALTGFVALAYGAEFVTGFYFDSGEWSEWGRGERLQYTSVAIEQGGNWGIIDKNGSIVAPFIFEHAITIDNYTAFVKYNGLYGILYINNME